MQANRQRKFKAPRLLKGKDKARDSDSDGDNIPFMSSRQRLGPRDRGVIVMKTTFRSVRDREREYSY